MRQDGAVTGPLLLLDAASLYFRAFFGVPDTLRAPDGTPVNAVRGLLDFIARLATDREPDRVVACWDNDWRPAFRTDLLPSYKAHRVAEPDPAAEEVPDLLTPQVPIIAALLPALGVPVCGADGYEADDVIGSLAADAGGAVEIVTGDRDLFQLVDQRVRVLYTARGVGRAEVVDDEWLDAKYGVIGRQYADFATLRGDASDGLPGVRGIGEKTAALLLRQYGDLAGIEAAAADPASSMKPAARRAIAAAGDYLAVAPRVVAVRRDLALAIPASAPDPALLAELGGRYGIDGPIRRAAEALAGLPGQATAL
jgi:5'-3' exonuclease